MGPENQDGGGDNGSFEMEMQPVDPAALPAAGGGVAAGVEDAPARREIDDKISEAMVRAACAGLNSAIVGISGYRELEFTEEEIDQLDELWSPLLPTVSPLVAAIVGTVIIVGGKFALYRHLKKGDNDGRPTDARGRVREAVAGAGGEATEAAAARGA